MADFSSFLQGLSNAYGIDLAGGLESLKGAMASKTVQPAKKEETGSPFHYGHEEDEPNQSSNPRLPGDDLKGLPELFAKAKSDAEARQRLTDAGSRIFAGPPTEDIQVSRQPDTLTSINRTGEGMVKGEAPTEYAQADIHGMETPRKHRDWGSILKQASMSANSLGNALMRGKVGGDIMPEHVARFKQEQVDQLKARHSMWDEAYKASQALPSEVLTDPKFASLAQAKQALDLDMQDGKVDNEKNVSNFNLEFLRAKHGILAQEQANADELRISSLGRTAGATQDIGLGQRQRLEAIAGDPTNPNSAAARAELDKLKLSDVGTHRVGDQDVSLTGSQWAEHALTRPDKEREFGQRDRALDISASNAGEARAERETYRSQAALGSMIGESLRRHSKADADGEILNPEEAQQAALLENKDAILETARRAQVPFTFGPQGMEVNGRTYPPDQVGAALAALYQLSRTY